MTSRAFEAPEYMANRGKYAGPSILEMMEMELDKWISNEHAEEFCIGLATAIGIMRQPYSYLNMKPAPAFNEVVDNLLVASEKRVEEAARIAAEKDKKNA